MKKLLLSLSVLCMSLHIQSQEVISDIYQKGEKNKRYHSEFNSSTMLHFKLLIPGQISKIESISVEISLPGLWFPYINSGFINKLNEDTMTIGDKLPLLPVNHKILANTVFFSPAYEAISQKTSDSKLMKIEAVRFYIDSVYKTGQNNHAYEPLKSVGFSLKKPITDFFMPFYFAKQEVTNKEYREFTEWVRDSIAMELLVSEGFNEFKIDSKNNKYHLNWKLREKIYTPEHQEALNELYIHDNDRYYKTKTINKEKIIYNGVKIYPDTTVWLADFTFSYNQAHSQKYFWHPQYNEYPVVGVNWHQAQAFCQWKTKMLQNEIDKSKLPYTVVVDLPAEYEREYALNQFISNGIEQQTDKSYLPALFIEPCITKTMLGDEILWKQTNLFGKNGYFYTHPADISKIKWNEKESYPGSEKLVKADLDKNGINGLKSNVSEWMKESYQENWVPIIQMKEKLYKSINYKEYHKEFEKADKSKFSEQEYNLISKDIDLLTKCYSDIYPILFQLESEFDHLQHKDGKLVRGSNWYDETFEKQGFENSKAFISPEKSTSTIGFRYVVHLYKK